MPDISKGITAKVSFLFISKCPDSELFQIGRFSSDGQKSIKFDFVDWPKNLLLIYFFAVISFDGLDAKKTTRYFFIDIGAVQMN